MALAFLQRDVAVCIIDALSVVSTTVREGHLFATLRPRNGLMILCLRAEIGVRLNART